MALTNIYGLIDPVTGALRYVGKTRCVPARRLAQHLHEAKTSTAHAHRLYWLRSLDRPPKIEILERVPVEDVDEAERFWIAYFKFIGCDLVNRTPGGDGQSVGYKASPETREKMRRSMLGKNAGRVLSAERREQIRQSLVGRCLSDEHRKKIRDSMKARHRRPTPEAIAKSQRARERAVVELGSGQRFRSAAEAAQALGLNDKCIRQVLRRRARTTGNGYRFEYADGGVA